MSAVDRRTRGRLRERSWRQEAADFYSQFVGPGSLVFDVGANVGSRTRVFLNLGCRVVAVEPQPALARRLRRMSSVAVEQVALGAQPGRATLRIPQAHTIASLCDEWIAAVKRSGRFAEYNWTGEIEVEVTTLDALIKRHGLPDFVKIDVEGYEPEVIAGLAQPVRALSFEYVPEIAANGARCVRMLDGYEFNFAEGLRLELAWRWVGPSEALRRLEGSGVGDIYARC